MAKKSQVSVFLIVSLVLVFVLGIVFYANSSSIKAKTEKEAFNENEKTILKDYIDSCIKSTVDDGLFYSGIDNVSDYVEKNLDSCLSFDGFFYEIDKGKLQSASFKTKDNKSLVIEISYPITFTDKKKQFFVSDFYLNYPLFKDYSLQTDSEGRVLFDVSVVSSDKRTRVFVPKGTFAFESNGEELKNINIQIKNISDYPRFNLSGVLAYDITPNGAKFEPAIDISIRYSDDMLEKGFNESLLKIAYFDYDIKSWVVLNSSVKPKENVVYAKVSHFTPYVLLKGTKEKDIISASGIPCSFDGDCARVSDYLFCNCENKENGRCEESMGECASKKCENAKDCEFGMNCIGYKENLEKRCIWANSYASFDRSSEENLNVAFFRGGDGSKVKNGEAIIPCGSDGDCAKVSDYLYCDCESKNLGKCESGLGKCVSKSCKENSDCELNMGCFPFGSLAGEKKCSWAYSYYNYASGFEGGYASPYGFKGGMGENVKGGKTEILCRLNSECFKISRFLYCDCEKTAGRTDTVCKEGFGKCVNKKCESSEDCDIGFVCIGFPYKRCILPSAFWGNVYQRSLDFAVTKEAPDEA